MRTFASVVATAVTVAASAGSAGATGSPALRPANAGWAATATKTLQLVHATDLGKISDATPLRLVVGLRMRDRAGAMNLVHREHNPHDPMYHKTVTPAQFTAAYNATGAQVNAVAAYLSANGFTNVEVEPNNLMITANATAGQASRAFNTQIDAFRQFGRVIYAQVKDAQVPTSLAGVVTSVMGLNDIAWRTNVVRAPRTNTVGSTRTGNATAQPDACIGPVIPTTNDCLRSYTAHDFQAAYSGLDVVPRNSNHGYDGRDSTTGFADSIAVFAQGKLDQVLPDLRKYEAVNGLAQAPYSVVRVGIPSPDTAGLIEWDLDSQSSTGIAAQVRHLYMYDTTTLTDSDTGLEFNRFVTQDVAREGNASFGECETFPYVDGAMVLDDEVFLQAAAQGQTVFVSSGDNGSGCPVVLSTGIPASGPPGVSYPASSPYVVAVGGTTLVSDANTAAYGGEKAWEGSGGGPSQFENEPYWQMGVALIPAQGALRQTPDVAMDADPNTGAIIYSNGVSTVVGGTSLASPLTMGTYARLMTSHGDEMGFASPNLYYEYLKFPAPTPPAVPSGPPGFLTNLVGGFHDVYIGTNGAYQALPRYDLVTGLGSLDIGHQTVDVDLVDDGDGQ